MTFQSVLCHFHIWDLQNHRKVAVDKCQLDIGFVLFYKQYITGNVILGYFSKTSIFQKHRNYKEGPSYNPLLVNDQSPPRLKVCSHSM